jgi:hypothetical protein
LARWIAGKDNPLTARVAINHMWLRHFGKALVPTVSNFGLSGSPPSHPELLDWLAMEFMEKNWSMKAMHRLMVTSNAYRMRSASADRRHPNLGIDPENRYLWRMNSRRMEAEVVRDSVLYVAGELDTTMGGPELEETRGLESYRRSIYFRQTPYSQMELLKLFDAANPNECYERVESVVPQQALAMANSSLTLAMARNLARNISLKTAGKPDLAFVAIAFEAVLGRPPTAIESAKSVGFLESQARLFQDTKKLTSFGGDSVTEVQSPIDFNTRARENLVHVLFNHNEFVTIR